jgi:hypothetical protein
MVAFLTAWQQTETFDPTDPTQQQFWYWTQVPGGPTMFTYNKVAPPQGSQLLGAGLGASVDCWKQKNGSIICCGESGGVYTCGTSTGETKTYASRMHAARSLALNGLGMSMPDWMSVALVTLVGFGAGYFGWKHVGPPIKKKLGLSGRRR